MTGEYRVTARNPSQGSENRIHADDVARRHGFRGGLVPGVTVYGYIAGALIDRLGADWISAGAAQARFRAPCYDGDDVTIAIVGPAAGESAFEVRSSGEVSVTGTAQVRGAGPGVAAGSVPVPAAPAPAPEDRPLVSADLLEEGRVLGTFELSTDVGAVGAHRARMDGWPSKAFELLDERGWVHPAMLLEAVNWVLTANMVLPLWLHVGSEIVHRRPVSAGELVSVRGRVARRWDAKGHRFVTLDVSWVAGEDEVAAGAHTAIWELSGAGG